MTAGPPPVNVPLLGMPVTPLTANELIDVLLEPAEDVSLVLNHNVHSAYLWHKDPEFRAFYDHAQSIVVDGWPILKLLQTSGDWSPLHRYGSTDWLEVLMVKGNRCERRLFVVGAQKHVHAAALERLRESLPGWTIDGVDGYSDTIDDPERLLETIAAFRPNIVLVALGMPRQEQLLGVLREKLPRAHYATVGGAVDYIAGFKPLSPRWLGRMGLEWLWRLAHEPRRLGGRYLVEPFHLLGLVFWRRLRSTRPDA